MCTVSSPCSNRALVVAVVALSLLPCPAQTQSTLTELTGWEVPGLESVAVEAATVGADYFTGELPALQFPGADTAPRIAGFPSGVEGQLAVVVSLPLCQHTTRSRSSP